MNRSVLGRLVQKAEAFFFGHRLHTLGAIAAFTAVVERGTVHGAARDLAERPRPVVHEIQVRVEVGHETRVLALDERLEHVLLVVEVRVEGAAREACPLADLLDGAPEDAALREHDERRVEDPFARRVASRTAW